MPRTKSTFHETGFRVFFVCFGLVLRLYNALGDSISQAPFDFILRERENSSLCVDPETMPCQEASSSLD